MTDDFYLAPDFPLKSGLWINPGTLVPPSYKVPFEPLKGKLGLFHLPPLVTVLPEFITTILAIMIKLPTNLTSII